MNGTDAPSDGGGGSRGRQHVTVADGSGGERRELFGFRRTVKATATGLFRATSRRGMAIHSDQLSMPKALA